MTIPAPHMAALKKSHKADAGSVYGTKTVDGVNVACCFHIKVSLLPESAGDKNKDKITKYATWGLFLFVAIPLPGTGAWTGALVASLLDMKRSKALISIFAGVLAAATLVSLICYGFIDFLRFLI